MPQYACKVHKCLYTWHYISGVNTAEDAQVVYCVHAGTSPESIPEDLAPRLKHFHGHPYIWWLSQFLKYITRPTNAFTTDMENMTRKMGFANPIVG